MRQERKQPTNIKPLDTALMRERIRYLRVKNKFTLREVEARTGISRSMLNNLEKDMPWHIPLAYIMSLAELYGVSIEYLCGFVDSPRRDKRRWRTPKHDKGE